MTADPTCSSQWRTLLGQAETLSDCVLSEDLESYLVQLLIRVTSTPAMLEGLLALDQLADQPPLTPRTDYLRGIGDQCLLFAGLFPEYAEERMVRLSHFVSLGRTAYRQLHELSPEHAGGVYARLETEFICLVDLLHTMCELRDDSVSLTPLYAFDLWHDTGSRRALRFIRSLTDACPVKSMSDPPVMM